MTQDGLNYQAVHHAMVMCECHRDILYQVRWLVC